jgi:hypothetical protein
VYVTFEREIEKEIAAAHEARLDAPWDDPDAIDGHSMFLRCKVAAHLTLFRMRERVKMDDWRRAGMIVDTSRGCVRWLLEWRKRQGDEAEEEERARRTRSTEAAYVASQQAPDRVAALARRVGTKVHTKGEMTRRELTQFAKSNERHLIDAACSVAATEGFITWDGIKAAPSTKRPA